MNTPNYNAPARALYNNFLRDILRIESADVGYDYVVWFTKHDMLVYVDFPFMGDISVGYGSRDLRNVWTSVVYKFAAAERKRDTIAIGGWLNAVRGFYRETD